VVMEFIEYLYCLDKGLSNISSEAFSLWDFGSLQWSVGRDSLLSHAIYSYEMCAWFCIVCMNGCVFFFLMRLLWVDILLEDSVFGRSSFSSAALTFS
jgi:hypothetical protein